MTGRRNGISGFTLMETLVMLVLVSVTATLMFQMLGSYRIARERFIAQSGKFDRQSLFAAWFRSSVQGLQALRDSPLEGSADAFSAITLNPLYGAAGAPAEVRWELVEAPSGATLRYFENGTERWQLPLAGGGHARFQYLDAAGEVHDRWPPATGIQASLPASIALVREGRALRSVQVASVRGALGWIERPFEIEQF